ncbi:MAG TPA: inosine/xanthosine triphosphatase [Candidatus Nanoarchaeia archaeon]|nr:inosine/xanthosine triphosphatase [Candidatus Nanoarchaeia archaeon]
MKIAVGSSNPVKIAAAERAVRKVWPEASIFSFNAKSGVPDQPLSDEECITGAKNRASEALRMMGADFGIGIEAGVEDSEHGMLMIGWVAVIDKEGKLGLGGSGAILLPELIAEKVRKGGEVGPLADEFLGETNIKQKNGTVGALTGNLVTRTETLERAVTFALARFMSHGYYDRTSA